MFSVKLYQKTGEEAIASIHDGFTLSNGQLSFYEIIMADTK